MAGFFDTLFGGGAEREAADRNRTQLGTYQTQGNGILDNGLSQSSGYLNSALGAYAPLSTLASLYGGGARTYMDALGLNGPAGTQAAQNAFTASPGYQFSLDQGLEALNRRRAAGGMLNSGNADIDALKFGQGLASQEYGSWLDRLSGINNNALTATTGAAQGQSGAYGTLANLYQQDAGNRLGVLGNYTSGMMGANQLQAQGEAAGAKNLLGFGSTIASLAMGGMGGGMGGLLGSSSGGGSLFGSFGSGPITYGGPNGPTPFYRG